MPSTEVTIISQVELEWPVMEKLSREVIDFGPPPVSPAQVAAYPGVPAYIAAV